VAVLIPSIDLMDGKIVQLVQGERLALEFSNFETWIDRFRPFPLVQLIDLDAATGRGDNSALIDLFLKSLPCQVGGGVRSEDRAKQLIEAGAVRVIFGSALVQRDKIDTEFAARVSDRFGHGKLTFAIDSKNGSVAVQGWRERTCFEAVSMMEILEAYTGAFLYTHVDTEGLQQGFPIERARQLRGATRRRLIVAGGVSTHEQVNELDAMGVDAIVGMAIYTGKMELTV
jgi:phosphoribosylformimino-5-aminoimidazole carboxamide ribotide isomerase